MHPLHKIIENNKRWANGSKNLDLPYFSDLSKGQSPKYLWIGCSDSRVPESQLAGLKAGEVFVHRNIANLVIHSDINCLSVIEYAIEVLKVKHVVICGHYNCGGIEAVLNNETKGIIYNWLQHIEDTIELYNDELLSLNEREKFDRVCELNVIEQVKNVSKTKIVKDAKERGEALTIHGLIYNLKDGLLKEIATIKL